jgi:hypothetical protein
VCTEWLDPDGFDSYRLGKAPLAFQGQISAEINNPS